MKAVVTGASGFTGLALARTLQDRGVEVLALVRPSSNVSELQTANVVVKAIDFFDPTQLESALQGVDVVFHLAAAYRTEHADTTEFHRVNVELTGLLLTAARAAGVHRFVHCSTVGVQGEIEDPPASEEYRLKPGDHYQDSKLAGERLAIEFNSDTFETTVIRPVGIYGPGDTRFLKLFKAINQRIFLMIGSGRTLYHLTYIDDLVEGFWLAATASAAPGEVFTICGPEVGSLNELTARIAKQLGVPAPRLRIPLWPVLFASHIADWVFKRFGKQSPLYPRRVEFFRFSRAFTPDKARRLLGYDPQVDLDQGLAKTIAAYRSSELL